MNQSNDSGLNLDHLEALGPCPFCGGAAKFERVGNWHDLVVSHVDDCLLSGDTAEMSYLESPGVQHRMASKWNRRAALANQPAPTDWQAAHADMVKRNALLRERPDLPADRIPAHAELVRLQEENARLRANQPTPTVPASGDLNWHKEALAAYEGKLRAVWQGVRDVVEKYSGSPCEGEPFDRLDELLARLAHQPAQEQAEPFKWPNGCDRTIPRALRYLAKNPRPSGGEETFNGAHLYQLAGEMEAAARKIAAQQEPVAAPQQGTRIIGGQRWSKEDEMTEGWIAAQQAAAPGALHYVCRGKIGTYAMVGTAKGAGKSKLVEPLVIYRDIDDGQLYFRTSEDFRERMEITGAPSAPGTPEAPAELAHGHRDDYYLLANGRRLGLEPISRVRNMPNWVLAMELFATGSGSAYQICRDAGVDPEGTTIQRAAQLDGGQEGSES
jgi:hypothetical protein